MFNKFNTWSSAGDFLKGLLESNETLQLNSRFFLEAWGRHTIRLATNKNKDDKEYVFFWYNKVRELDIDVPNDIPFIFREV